jgi:hypothetical protein
MLSIEAYRIKVYGLIPSIACIPSYEQRRKVLIIYWLGWCIRIFKE